MLPDTLYNTQDESTTFTVKVRDALTEFEWCWSDLSSIQAGENIEIVKEGGLRRLTIQNSLKMGLKEIHAFCDGSWLSRRSEKN